MTTMRQGGTLPRVYLDTEFTTIDPVEEAELLSVGLVADDGREIYVERLDDELRAHCSEFVHCEVLPQFGQVRGATVSSYRELADRLAGFLMELGGRVRLCYDYKTDRELVAHALEHAAAWPELAWLNVAIESSTNEAQGTIEAYWREAQACSTLKPHHALADARALRAGVEADMRSGRPA